MPQIGTFTRDDGGFAGHIHTLTMSKEVVLVAADTGTENAPDYRLHLGDADGPEVGAGWKRTGERAGDYIATILDDPTFVQPIRANLFRDSIDGSSWSLHWNRPAKASERR